MLFDWKQYNEIADTLRRQGDQGILAEACYRSAVSRYYYASFCHARNYARDGLNANVPKFTPSYSGEDHGKVIEHYRRHQRIFGSTHSHLARLLQLRAAADYQDEVDEHERKAAFAASLARKILETLH